MIDIQAAVAQLDKILADLKILSSNSNRGDLSDMKVDGPIILNRMYAAVERLSLPGSSYAKQADLLRAKGIDFVWVIGDMAGVVGALREDLAEGWTSSIIELVHADTYSDFLDMASGLVDNAYKDAAAVIAGTALEVHLRALCIKHGVDIDDTSGRPKKADVMNADLKKAGVYGGLQQKQVTSWLGLRNSAAHGNYSDYDVNEVKQLIDAVRSFMLKYPA